MKIFRWTLRKKRLAGKIGRQAVCAVLILGLSGCWNSREIDDLSIVMGMGVDLSVEEPGKVRITTQLDMPGELGATQQDSSGGENRETYWNVSCTGESVFQAVREMTRKTCHKLFFPHNQVLIFGYSAAEEGIQKYMDFFERDHETRNKVRLIISETTAKDILEVKSKQEELPAVSVSTLIMEYARATSKTKDVMLLDYISNFMSATTSAVAPIVGVTKEGDEEMVEITGTAVFKADKVVGRLDQKESRGLLWVLGEVKSGIINVNDREGSLVSTEIVRSRAKVRSVLEDGKILIKIDVFEEGNIGEQTGTANLGEMSEVVYLEDRISEAIRDEVTAAINKAWMLNTDIFGFGSLIKSRHFKQWKDMEDNWDELFRTIEIELTVDTQLHLMGKITKPLVPEKG